MKKIFWLWILLFVPSLVSAFFFEVEDVRVVEQKVRVEVNQEAGILGFEIVAVLENVSEGEVRMDYRLSKRQIWILDVRF